MKLNNFILSEKIKFRLGRHVVFWSLVFLFFFGFFFFQRIGKISDWSFDKTLFEISEAMKMTNFSSQIREVMQLTIILVYTYLVAYWLVPYYFSKKKYLTFGLWLIMVTLIAELCRLYLSGLRLNTPKEDALLILWFQGLGFVNDGPPILCGLFLTIKMVKTWYVKQEEELILIRENTNAELQLLKAQVHPHFLFNTLNNIYSFALNNSPKAPELVLKLSTMMKYMIYDCKASSVSVEKEINMIQDYIGLEKVRYGNRLRLEVSITGNLQNKFMAPLLLIPFVENSFKHGTSKMLTHSWIRLAIDVSHDTLHFTLSNSRPSSKLITNGNNGIGLTNVGKRLQLLYPGQHSLWLESQDESFTVNMKIPVHESLNPIEPIEILSNHSPEPAYVGA